MMKPNIAVLAYPMLNCVKASERSAINTWVNRAMLGNEVTEERLKTVSPVYQVNKDVHRRLSGIQQKILLFRLKIR